MWSKPLTFTALLALALLTGCVRKTHHSLIWVEQPANRVFSIEKNRAEFSEIVRIVDDWAKAEGFIKAAPEQGGAMRQSWSTTAANGNEQTVYYREAEPQDKRWPIEVMIAFDPDSDTEYARISTGEGYRKKPSEKLQHLHATLGERLARRHGKNVRASIW